MSKICILNLKNRQEEYAVALDFIKAIEDKNSGTIEERKKILLEIVSKISISIGNVQKNVAARYLEQPISVTAKGRNRAETIQDKQDFY